MRARAVAQAERHAPDRAQVGGDVLADDAVAARRAHGQLRRPRRPARPPAPSSFGSTTYSTRSRPSSLRTRASNSAISSRVVTFASDSICWPCRTVSKVLCGAAPTRWVGESAVTSSGCARLERLQAAEELVVLGVRDLRIVEHVVAMVVVRDGATQLDRFVPHVARRPCHSRTGSSSLLAGRHLVNHRAVPRRPSCSSSPCWRPAFRVPRARSRCPVEALHAAERAAACWCIRTTPRR